MPKTITLRLSDRDYALVRAYAEADNRPIANLIETAALKHLHASSVASTAEVAEIKADRRLMGRLKAGHRDADLRRGRFVA